MKTVHFETLGCKLNQIESESAARYFSGAGFTVTAHPYTAAGGMQSDVILCVVNTCTVTGKAEQKARRTISLLLSLCPNAAVLVTGCYAELEKLFIEKIDTRVAVLKGSRKEEIADLPAHLLSYLEKPVNSSSNTADGEKLAFFLRNLFSEPREQSETFGQSSNAVQKPAFSLSTDTFIEHSRASIKIQDGCSNSCTYCRIRLARGAPVSLEPAEIVSRILQIEKAGHSEVVLTGVNLTQYSGTLPDGKHADFAVLLSYLLTNTSSISFRISSLYPERVDDEFCTVIADKRIRPHFHLSVQSGSDYILERMKRPYKAVQVLEAVRRLRSVKNDPFIACDIITGFPGETDKEFYKTYELCRECRFTYIHAFPFSPRPGTEAFTMKPLVPQSAAGERVKRLTELASSEKTAFIERWKNIPLDAVLEKRTGRELRAVTENFIHARVTLHPDSICTADDVEKRKGTAVTVIITAPNQAAGRDADGLLVL